MNILLIPYSNYDPLSIFSMFTFIASFLLSYSSPFLLLDSYFSLYSWASPPHTTSLLFSLRALEPLSTVSKAMSLVISLNVAGVSDCATGCRGITAARRPWLRYYFWTISWHVSALWTHMIRYALEVCRLSYHVDDESSVCIYRRDSQTAKYSTLGLFDAIFLMFTTFQRIEMIFMFLIIWYFS